jgi:hypothetical protein
MPISKRILALAPFALLIIFLIVPVRAPAGGAVPQGQPQPPQKDYPVRPVAFTDVKLFDVFWAPRLETNRTVSVPYALRMN